MSQQIIYAGHGFVGGELRAAVAVLVENGVIAVVDTLANMRAAHPHVDTFGGDQYALLPGFINSHDHGRAFGTLAGGTPDHVLEIWLNMLGNQAMLTPRLSALLEGWLLVRAGVTATAHSHNPLTWAGMFAEIPHTLAAYEQAGVRVALHPPIIDQNRLVYADQAGFIASLPPDLRNRVAGMADPLPLTHDDYFAALTALYDAHHDAEGYRVHIQVSPAGGQWCSDTLMLRAQAWARERNTRVQMHMLESQQQQAYAWRTWGIGFIEHLDQIGVLDDALTLAHMVWLEPNDIERLRAAGTGIAHNPSSNLRLRCGIAPLADLLNAGVRVGIGMDGQTLDDDQDYGRELRLAWTLANLNGLAVDPPIRPQQVITAGTATGAAITFGADAPLGEIAVGKLADLVLIDYAALRGAYLPPDQPDAALNTDLLLRRLTHQHVRHVMIGGEWVLRDGQHTRIDEAALFAEVREHLQGQSAPLDDALRPYLETFYREWDG